VLHDREDDLVALLEFVPPPGLRDQIDRLRRPARKDTLRGVRRIDELRDRLTSPFVRVGRPLAQLVDAPVDVGVLLSNWGNP